MLPPLLPPPQAFSPLKKKKQTNHQPSKVKDLEEGRLSSLHVLRFPSAKDAFFPVWWGCWWPLAPPWLCSPPGAEGEGGTPPTPPAAAAPPNLPLPRRGAEGCSRWRRQKVTLNSQIHISTGQTGHTEMYLYIIPHRSFSHVNYS